LFGIDLTEELEEQKSYGIWPEHEDAVIMFLKCQTQWRVASHGVIGLDYNAVFSMLKLYNVDNQAKVMEDLQVMESRALEIFTDAAIKSQKKGRR